MLELHLHNIHDNGESGHVRRLGYDPIVLGRDDNADWTIPAADKSVSRRHVEITPVGDTVHAKALGQNGFRLEKTNEIVASGDTAILGDGESFVIGDFIIVLKKSGADDFSDRDENDPAVLFDAFLDGAGLNSSAFVVDSAPDVLRRAGKIYIAAVCGLCELMKERNKFKDHLAIDQTTISAGENNPLRWGAPNRIAVELLQKPEPGFLEGDAALKASLLDIRSHMKSMTSGYQSVLTAALGRLAPHAIDQQTEKSVLSSGMKRKWEAYARAHAELAEEINESLLGISDAFASGYQAGSRKNTDIDKHEDAA